MATWRQINEDVPEYVKYQDLIKELKRNKKEADTFLVEEDSGILFMEDKEGDLCSFRAVRKVHEVNRHKGKEQLMAAYQNAG